MADGKGVTVLFLGSGFTRGIGRIPTQKEGSFIDSVLGDGREARISFYKINGVPLPTWIRKIGDIEVCMSHLHNLAYSNLATPSSKGMAKKAIINLRSAIRDYMIAQKVEKWDVACEFARRFIRDAGKDKVVILTTNYDLFTENVLKEGQGLEFEYPEIPLQRAHQEHAVPLYKLHGSINWMEERRVGDRELIGVEPLYVRDDLADAKLDFVNVSNETHISCKEKGGYWVYKENGTGRVYTPILIPFFYQKEEWLGQRWGYLFQRHWASAKNWFYDNEIEKMFFIGCGLPRADTYLMSWLLSIFQKKKPETIKIVCDGDPDNLGKALSPFINPDEDIYKCGLKHFLDHFKS
ncbi:MAG: SIR2 family protein [Candidatus Tectomicrobia bacterium]|uniref:SIR2 family protein n=1 Tax=Tectimicrobiota bacterium TaxID=2528274 RepID=A0A932I1M2_UNCTE|nr:SIR2 family protein [Candidatus Tectomicrobia bacterium]